MAVRVFEGIDELEPAVGTHLGHSDWVVVDPARVASFHRATGGDERQATAVPPGLALSMVNLFLPQVVEVRGISMGLNYGSDGIEFPAPAAVGSRLRGGVELTALDEVRGGVQAAWRVTVEVDGGDEPACVASSLARYLR